MSKKNFLTLTLILGIAFILNFFNVRLCPFFNVFKIPCPGCGLTRAFKLLLTGHILSSLKYNPLAIILSVAFAIYFISFVFGKKDYLDKFVEKHKKTIIAISIVLTVIVWYINIRNPLLY